MASQNLAIVNTATLQTFLNSFDKVICDCDGVIWNAYNPIIGVKETLSKLNQCGKEVYFATNNCSHNLEYVYNKFKEFNKHINRENIAYPTIAIMDYLRQIGYNKHVFLIGCNNMRQEFIDAGYIIATSPEPINNDEAMLYLLKSLQDDENVGAVIVDIDLEITLVKIYQATIFLRRPEVLFFFGSTARKLLGRRELIGPSYFQSILEDFTGRVPLCFGKPGLNFNKYLIKRFNITDPSRILFVGDSLIQDMEFAAKYGYQKLLVLSGTTNINDLTKCTDEQKIPDFHLDSFGDLHVLLSRKLNI